MEPWQLELRAGQTQAAWNRFIERYQRVIVATIRRHLTDHDDVMEIFSRVCESLSENECARLARYSDRHQSGARVSTWLVAVVRNLTVDWLRARDGRQRAAAPENLTEMQQAIHQAICAEGLSHVEAYETIRSRTGSTLAFHEFLREVRTTRSAAPCPGALPLRTAAPHDTLDTLASAVATPAASAEAADLAVRLSGALMQQPADVRLAIELFVVDGLGADEVARTVGWTNAKAVYNRVSRALASVRAVLKRDGVGPTDASE